MPARITALAGGDPRLEDPAFLTRSLFESLADAYADMLSELDALTGRSPRRVVVVGGGARTRS